MTGPGGMAGAGRVGPNAVIQLAGALADRLDRRTRDAVFTRAGLGALLARPPEAMVDERAVAGLFAALRAELPEGEAGAVLDEAGRRTADYIIAHRIPAPAQRLMAALPAFLGGRLLLGAIGRHAWTFAGSGAVRCGYGRPLTLAIAPNPLASPGCAWHAAVLERLFRRLVDAGSAVAHGPCCARGDNVCAFEILIRPQAALARGVALKRPRP